jgi:hypothetical protein
MFKSRLVEAPALVGVNLVDALDAMGGSDQAHILEKESGALHHLALVLDNPHGTVANLGRSRRYLNLTIGKLVLNRTAMARKTGSD